jgi:elongation factor Ts
MSLDEIKKLRELTSLGLNDCKKALEETKGDFDRAVQILKQKGVEIMEKKGERLTHQGIIESYVHFGGNLGALVEVNCETDFVARTDLFRRFVKDIAMQVAAASPKYIKRQDIPQEILATIDNVDEYARSNCLLEQLFIKNSKITIGDYLKEVVSQTKENIVIRRFVRFSLGE